MKNKILLLIFCSVLLSSFFLAGTEPVLANDAPVCPPCPPVSCFGRSWTEYRCTSDCDGEIETRSCSYSCWCSGSDACGCCTGCACSPTTCTDWVSEGTTGQPWQKCIDDSNPETKPYFACMGECLETPKSPPRYYDNPTYSDQPDKDKGNTDIYLPVKLDWDDVFSWGKEDGASSYRSRAESEKNTYEKVIVQSELIPESCSLKSNSDYNWKVRACCNLDGTNCGGWSNWGFQTNLTPEPILPPDPDWNGPEEIKDLEIPITLDWCDVIEAQSYYLQVYKGDEKEAYLPLPIDKKNGFLGSEFNDEKTGFLTKDRFYKWEVATCLNEDGSKCSLTCPEDMKGDECGDYSQKWSLITTGELPPPELISPKSPDGVPIVNLSSELKWKGVKWAFSYRYQIKEGGVIKVDLPTGFHIIPFDIFWDILNFDTIYNWHVKSCWDTEGNECEKEWSEKWSFKTTGAQPTFAEPDTGPSNKANVPIPVKLNWDDMPGAVSYYYEISPDLSFGKDGTIKGVVINSEASVDYPDLKMEKKYWWRVKTCADREGKVCGEFNNTRNFTTLSAPPPEIESPKLNSEEILPIILKWKKINKTGWKGEWYRIWLTSEGKTIKKGPVPCCSAYFSSLETFKEYQWKISSCIAKADTEKEEKEKCGEWSNEESFKVIEPTPPAWGGIVPCGRKANDPNTSYDETESCQIKHLFLMLKNTLDFLLWRLAPIFLVLLIIATGTIFYFSLGAPTTLTQVKSLWKMVGIGYLVIFFAWIIVNMFLKTFGYTVKWWIITF